MFRFRIGGMGMGMPMMGMMGGPPPGLLQKKKEEARKAAEEEAAESGTPLGSMDHGTIRQRARGPRKFYFSGAGATKLILFVSW